STTHFTVFTTSLNSESQHIQTRHREAGPPIEETGQPVVLTVNGKAELIVQDAESYQKLLEAKDRMEAIEGIKRGLKSMKRNAGKPEIFDLTISVVSILPFPYPHIRWHIQSLTSKKCSVILLKTMSEGIRYREIACGHEPIIWRVASPRDSLFCWVIPS